MIRSNHLLRHLRRMRELYVLRQQVLIEALARAALRAAAKKLVTVLRAQPRG
jgi:DNA-binding transcriptional MocR family regulator